MKRFFVLLLFIVVTWLIAIYVIQPIACGIIGLADAEQDMAE